MRRADENLFHDLSYLSNTMDHFDFVVVDSKTTNDAFRFNGSDVLEFGHIISRCQRLFLHNSQALGFNKQQANMVVYALAEEAVLSASPTIYFHILRYHN